MGGILQCKKLCVNMQDAASCCVNSRFLDYNRL